MTAGKRPRVAAIGLDEAQLESIRPFCGELKVAATLVDFVGGNALTETDIIVGRDLESSNVSAASFLDPTISVLAFGDFSFYWSDTFERGSGYDMGTRRQSHKASTSHKNTERELTVIPSTGHPYEPLARQLAKDLSRLGQAPTTVGATRLDKIALVTTTSGNSVALRVSVATKQRSGERQQAKAIALLLPMVSNVASWFQAFLTDVHNSDPERVPQAPPRLASPSDWYTPEERLLVGQMSTVEQQIKDLSRQLDELKAQQHQEAEIANKGKRRILWADGDELKEVASEILAQFGFIVRDMDSELAAGEPKREDLRLIRPGYSDWEAIVEVKGYTGGAKLNDSHQIRQHREDYIASRGGPPQLTLWLANTFRTMDPSGRPPPDGNVRNRSEAIGVVFAHATDLFRQWVRVAACEIDAEVVTQSLVDAKPGVWFLPD